LTLSRWLPPLAWAVLILVLTSIPQPHLPDVRGIDKLGHLCMYGVLGLLTVRSFATDLRPWRIFLLVLLGICLFGALDEWHQQFIPGRTMDVRDWLADSLGAGLGGMLSVAALLRRERQAS
jgi:VanZ family protein